MAKSKDTPTAPTVPAGPTPDAVDRDAAADAKPTPPAEDVRDAEVAALRAELKEMRELIRAGAVDQVAASQEERSRREQEAIAAEVAKGNQQRTQEEADRRFPEGKHRWKCVLADGNGHPEIVVSATNAVDAAARYCDVCGIKGYDQSKFTLAVERA